MKLRHKPSCKRTFGRKDPSCPGCNPDLVLRTSQERKGERSRALPDAQAYLTLDEALAFLRVPYQSFVRLARGGCIQHVRLERPTNGESWGHTLAAAASLSGRTA
jgi:hypothetical protein